jgi:hypothetical protein
MGQAVLRTLDWTADEPGSSYRIKNIAASISVILEYVWIFPKLKYGLICSYYFNRSNYLTNFFSICMH